MPAILSRVKIVGIAGGSGSGKTTVVSRITEIVRDFALVAQDNYYKSAENITNTNITEFNPRSGLYADLGRGSTPTSTTRTPSTAICFASSWRR